MKTKKQSPQKTLSLLERIYTDSDFAQQVGDPLFPTSISQPQGELLASWVKKAAPQHILELGFGYGVASLWIESSRPARSMHTIVDHLIMAKKSSPVFSFMKAQNKVSFEQKYSSQEFLAAQLKKKTKYDFIFLDADLKFDGFMTDMYFVTKLLSLGGLVVIRNVWNPSIRAGLMFLLKNLPYRLEHVDLEDEHFIRSIPYFGARKLEKLLRPMDFAVLRLVGQDTREWNHFVAF